MKGEIKEILDWLKDEDIYIEEIGYQYKRISLRESKLLLDYITNLQEENERLKEDIRKDEVYFKTFELAEECDQKQDIIDTYKSRNEKAIEILNEGLKELDKRGRNEVYIEEYLENALDILKGSDK